MQSVTNLKSGLLGRTTSNLNLEEMLVALAISANTNTLAQLAMEKIPLLRNCEVHMTHLSTASDFNGMRRLGLRVTCDPAFPTKNLYDRA